MPEAKNERATPVRAGEELPVAALAAYLFDALPELRAEFDDEIVVAQFGQGYSNLTYLVAVGGRELVLRRPPIGANIATAHDMGREVKVLTGLARVYGLVPRVLLHCEDEQVIGAPFYVMERLQGVVLRADDPQRPLIPGATMAQLANNVIDNLAAIHALDVEAAGLADLGRPAGYVARQVGGWTKRYHAARTDELPNLERALRWLDEFQPGEAGPGGSPAIIHNDYKYDNLILDADELTHVVAVLDWEMCTLGDPLLDLGTTLGYWLEPGDPPALLEMFGLTALPGNPDRAAVVERYLAASGHDDFDPLFYYVYGLVKIGVILQQIYYRYRLGKSQDARFARLGHAVAACGQMAAAALDQRRISGLF
jgi:aminoglycoside phosphotransferase (APT) family kinase protein